VLTEQRSAAELAHGDALRSERAVCTRPVNLIGEPAIGTFSPPRVLDLGKHVPGGDVCIACDVGGVLNDTAGNIVAQRWDDQAWSSLGGPLLDDSTDVVAPGDPFVVRGVAVVGGALRLTGNLAERRPVSVVGYRDRDPAALGSVHTEQE
jgi:hypothetical protein